MQSIDYNLPMKYTTPFSPPSLSSDRSRSLSLLRLYLAAGPLAEVFDIDRVWGLDCFVTMCFGSRVARPLSALMPANLTAGLSYELLVLEGWAV